MFAFWYANILIDDDVGHPVLFSHWFIICIHMLLCLWHWYYYVLIYRSGDRESTCVSGQGAVSIRKTVLPGMAIPMLKIRRPNGRLIFNMEIAIRR